MSPLQHCAACQTEYVATALACAECGGVLQAGPLPRFEGRDDPAPAMDGAVEPMEPPTRVVATLPGAQAEQLAKLLTMEGIVCLLECEGLQRLRRPDDPVPEPIAVTLPVTLSVPPSRFDDAQAILASLDQTDAIGTQWTDEGAPNQPGSDEALEEDAEESVTDLEPGEIPNIGPQPESTTWRFILILLLAAGLAFVLLR
jgi:hypothetical protein